MSVRSAMPWPFRWAILAIVLGFCAAIGLWAFEFGKDIAGLERGSKEEIVRLRAELAATHTELATATSERDEAQSVANTAGTLVATEKASHEHALAQVKQLEAENRSLRDDLGFFEKLIPAAGVDGVAIRGLQLEMLKGGSAVKWQVLVIQSNKNVSEFNGRLDLTFTGTVNSKPWTMSLPNGPQTIKIRQYGRLEGEFDLPEQVIVKGVTAKVMDGTIVRATQTVKL
jgi:hypothetical protein